MAKTRLLLDTCAVIDLITSSDETDVEFWDIYDDPDTMPYASFETARELVVLFNNKKLLSKYWKTAESPSISHSFPATKSFHSTAIRVLN